jgi:hypothetical protein
VPYEAVVPDRNQFTDESMRLNAAISADLHVFLNFGERADEGRCADATTVDIDGGHDPHIRTKRNVDDSALENCG